MVKSVIIWSLILFNSYLFAAQTDFLKENVFPHKWQQLADSSFNQKEAYLLSFPSEIDSAFTFHLLYQFYILSDSAHYGIDRLLNIRNSESTRAYLYAFTGDVQNATALLEDYILQHPNNFSAISDYIVLLARFGELEKSSQLIQRLQQPLKNFALLVHYYHAEAFQKGAQIYQNCLKDHPLVYYYYAKILYKLVDWDTSTKILKEGIEIALADRDYKNIFLLASFLMLVDKERDSWSTDYTELAKNYGDSLSTIYALSHKAIADQRVQWNDEIAGRLLLFVEKTRVFHDYQHIIFLYKVLMDRYRRDYEFVKTNLYFKKSEEICLTYHYYNQLARLYAIQGIILKDLRLSGLAKWYLNKCIERIENHNLFDVQKTNYYKSVARLYEMDHEYLKAADVYKKLAEIEKHIPSEAALHLWRAGDNVQRAGNYKLAEKYYRQAYNSPLEERHQHIKLFSQYRIGESLMFQGNNDEAMFYFDNMLPTGNKVLDTEIQLDRGMIFRKQKEWDKAIEAFLEVLSYTEQERNNLGVESMRIGSINLRITYYELLIGCYLGKYKENSNPQLLDKIYESLEKIHARSLKDQIFSKELRKAFIQSTERNEKYQIDAHRLVQLQRYIRQNDYLKKSKSDWNKLLEELYTTRHQLLEQRLRLFGDLADYIIQDQPTALSAVAEQLKNKDTSILLFHIPDEHDYLDQANYAFVINQDKQEVIELDFSEADFLNHYQKLIYPLHHIQSNQPDSIQFNANAAHWFYKNLFEPVEKTIALEKNIIIVPGAKLAYIHFDLLLDKKQHREIYYKNDEPVYADNFLIHKYSFSYQPSTMTTDVGMRRKSFQPKILCMANPITKLDSKNSDSFILRDARVGWNLEPLPHAEREARDIQKIYKNTTVLTREQASEQYLKSHSESYDIIHLSTHAFTDTLFAEFSGIILTAQDDTTQDGILMGYELSEFDISPDLVVLSGCETGRGDLVKGEGVLGFPRQFIAAGTKSVIMSNWKVDDLFTSQFMPDFYKYYIQKRMTKAHALRQAKLDVLNETNSEKQKYKHPFYWASFSLYGEGSGRVSAIANVLYLILPGVMLFAVGVFIYLQKRKLYK